MIEELVALIPTQYWPSIGYWLTAALLAMIVCYVVLWAVDAIDMLDGRRDWPRTHAALSTMGVLAAYVVAFLEMLPVRIPFVDGLRRLRELSVERERAPHPDDLPMGDL